jgi:hypothetical protein
MSINILNLVYLVIGAISVAYILLPKFRANVNQLARVTWNKWFRTQVSNRDKAKDEGEQAIDKQKKARDAAIALLKEQKESVVKLSATATITSNELRRRQDAVTAAIKDYNDAKELKMSDADLDKLALKVKSARDAVSTQEANVKLAQANANRAAASLTSTTEKLQKFDQQILDNQDKLALADALNIQAQAEELTASIDSMLSSAGEANKEIDRILAEADARTKVGKDTTTDELERRRREKEAQDERDRLDGKKPSSDAGSSPSSSNGTGSSNSTTSGTTSDSTK